MTADDQDPSSLASRILRRVDELIQEADRQTRPLEIDPYHTQLFELFVTADGAGYTRENAEEDLTPDGLCRRPVRPLGTHRRRPRCRHPSDRPGPRTPRPHATPLVRHAHVDGMDLRLATLGRIPPPAAGCKRIARSWSVVRGKRCCVSIVFGHWAPTLSTPPSFDNPSLLNVL